jgi:hypothetical protein
MPNTMPFWGPLSPQKPNTTLFWGPLSPQKPTRRCFGDQVSPQISHVGPAHYFFLFWFLSYFSFSGLMGLDFFSTSDINVCIMDYYMTMGLGFFFAISDINVCIMGYYMTMGLGFFFLQSQILMYVLWVII